MIINKPELALGWIKLATLFPPGGKSNPWPSYSQQDRLALYLMTIHYLKGRFTEKWQERLMRLIKPHQADYKDKTIWAMYKTSQKQTNQKNKTWDYSRVARASRTHISGFKFWTKIIMCLNEAKRYFHSPEKCDCVVNFLIASKHLIFFPLLLGSQASKASLLLTSNYQGRWENSHPTSGGVPPFCFTWNITSHEENNSA